MQSFISIACLATAVFGESIGDSGSATARCHIYYEGDYGACNSYQVSNKDVTDQSCGDSVSNPCVSTFHPDMSAGGMSNCMNCYKLTINYKDGVSTCVYVKAVDTDGSDCKYEMSQIAWGKLCPVICQDDGLCAHSADQCQYGLIPQDPTWASMGVPESCAAQSYPVTWEVVDCNGGASGCGTASSGGGTPVQPTAAPVQPTQPTAAPVQPTQPTAAPVQPTQPTAAPPAPPAPSGGCVAPNGWGWGSSTCVSCSNPVSGQCPEYGYTTCYSDMSSCCAGCLGEGYCNPATCQ